ncbi:mRNA turnover protein 4-like protein [Gautieria morchelliformis]|nr:mRNA turnover protein 4-like protein [Gautieria morchelliformis]
MPKSKRAKVVSLTKTGKKDRLRKEDLLKQIQDNANLWEYVYAFRIGQMRNSHLKTVRKLWKDDARMFFGKRAVMSKALGTSPETEHRLGLHKIAQRIKGQTGLFFTSFAPDKTEEWFEDFNAPDFARAGNMADRDVVLPLGPISRSTDPPEPFPHNMDPQLRTLGLKTTLVKGVPTLTSEHIVCRKGDTLTPEQAQLLKLLLIQMVTFRVTLHARWDSKTGQITDLKPDDAQDTPVGMDEDEAISEMSG